MKSSAKLLLTGIDEILKLSDCDLTVEVNLITPPANVVEEKPDEKLDIMFVLICSVAVLCVTDIGAESKSLELDSETIEDFEGCNTVTVFELGFEEIRVIEEISVTISLLPEFKYRLSVELLAF